jgi:hypothetical protein
MCCVHSSHVAALTGALAARATCIVTGVMECRPCRTVPRHVPSARTGAQVPSCRAIWGMALGVYLSHSSNRPTLWRGTRTPPLRAAPAARTQASRCPGRYTQTGVRAYPVPQFCHAFAAGRHRHPHRVRVTRPQQRIHHHDLHPRAQGGCG